jgi:hypothetical protein
MAVLPLRRCHSVEYKDHKILISLVTPVELPQLFHSCFDHSGRHFPLISVHRPVMRGIYSHLASYVKYIIGEKVLDSPQPNPLVYQTMSAAQNTTTLSPPAAPPKDRPGRPAPTRIAEILAVVSVLATYGRHLAQTLEQRAVARGFATIARFFGTVAFDTILAHLHRGLMRAIALERMLRARAARGYDLPIPAPRVPSRRQPPANEPPDTGQTAGQTPPAELTPEPDAAAAREAAAREAAARQAEARLARRIAASEPLTLDSLPLMEAIEAEVRRSPVGRTIAAICRDLGISPSLCDGTFWNRVFDAIRLYRGSLGSLLLEVKRREQRFNREEWKHPGLDWPEDTRNGVRRVLGFFIGESPVDPFAIAAAPMAHVTAAATGPP